MNSHTDYDVIYDETNNYRKVFVRDGNLNIKNDNNFVLGGIVTKEKRDSKIWNGLYKKIGILNNIKELKAEHVFHGNFLLCLSSQRLNNFLHFLCDNRIFIHFFNLNILYWAIIDIVESILCLRKTSYELQRRAAAVLLEVARCDKLGFIGILAKFAYPNVKRRKEFVSNISHIITKNINGIDRSRTINDADICGLLCACARYENEELLFIKDGEEGTILDEFLFMYMHVPTQWPKARHIFDEESSIQELLAQQRATECDGFRLFFVDSQDDIRIQISDVLTGFLGKYFTFIDATTLPELRSLIPELSNNQRDSLCCLRELIQASDDFSRELSMRVDSIHNCEKSDFFLYSQENHG